MSITATLTAGGILRAAEVVELAAAAKLDLAAAAVLLVKESGGGRNVWGSDGVPTGGTYVKGSAVTREAYLAYKARRAELGSQGVGPCQLTWSGYQDQADELGGCWDWRCNVRVGFATLAQLQRQHGTRDGFRRYNGSGPAAERYADDAMAKLADWQARLGETPTPREDDDDVSPELERMIRELHAETFRRHPNRVDFRLLGEPEPGVRLADTPAGMAINADARAYEARQLAAQARFTAGEARDTAAEARDHAYTARTELAELRVDVLAALNSLGARPLSDGTALPVDIDLDVLADRIVARFADRLA